MSNIEMNNVEVKGEKALPFKKKNSLIESNPLAKWTQEVFMKEMDKFAYLRQNLIFALVFFFLGNNLNIYLYLFIGITIYMIVLRFIRWWVKTWLLYLFEFCYYGIASLIIYIWFFPNSQELFISTFSYSSGNMAIAAIIFSNSAQFGSTDHISSVWLHLTPIITCWCVRWREKIYSAEVLKFLKFDFVPSHNILPTDKIPLYFFGYPLAFWGCWCIYYVLFFYIMCNSFAHKYENGITDFKGLMKKLSFIFRENYNGIKWKYLLMHFILFLVGIPFAILCYYSFLFHLIFILIVMCYVFYNAGVQQAKFVSKKVKDKAQEEEGNSNLPKNEEIKE